MNRTLTRSLLALSLAACAVTLAAPAQAAPTGVKAKTKKPKRAKPAPQVKVLDGDTLMKAPGVGVVVEPKGKAALALVFVDCTSAYIYAVTLPTDGGPGEVCERTGGAKGSAGKCTFNELSMTKKTDSSSAAAPVRIQVMTVDKPTATTADQPPKIKYGPVITVKPKG